MVCFTAFWGVVDADIANSLHILYVQKLCQKIDHNCVGLFISLTDNVSWVGDIIHVCWFSAFVLFRQRLSYYVTQLSKSVSLGSMGTAQMPAPLEPTASEVKAPN
jgi:hypothetical protein